MLVFTYTRSTAAFDLHRPRETSKATTSTSLAKKSSNGITLDEASQINTSQIKLMPIMEGGEADDKLAELPHRLNKELSLTTTTLDWTPTEYVSCESVSNRVNPWPFFRIDPSTAAGRSTIDALFELSVRADSALKTALCENASMLANSAQTSSGSDRLTIRKSVSVMNQKQKTGSGRSLIRAKSEMAGADAR